MKKHRVLFFSYWYPNKYNRIFPVFTRKHGQAISNSAHVTVLSISICKSNLIFSKEFEIVLDEKGTETHQIYLYSWFYKLLYVFLPLHYWIAKNYCRKNLSEKKFDVIHSNILFPCAIVGSWLSKDLQTRHVITEHWSRLPAFFKKNLYRGIARRTYHSADAITCVSEQLAAVVRTYTSNKKIHVVPNVVDSSEFYFDPKPENKLTFVAAANWTEPKNPFPFLDALAELKSENKLPDFQMIMVGNGAQLEIVKQNNYQFPIIYTGILATKELRETLNRADIFLHGSDYETFSTIIAEALMCGLPSVVSKVGIAEEVINSRNGFTAENNKEDFKIKILSCYSTKYDRPEISAMISSKYNSETIGRQFAGIYDQI